MGITASDMNKMLKTMVKPCDDCSKYVFNSCHCKSSCCGGSCECNTDKVDVDSSDDDSPIKNKT